jgi:hypothetical protein
MVALVGLASGCSVTATRPAPRIDPDEYKPVTQLHEPKVPAPAETIQRVQAVQPAQRSTVMPNGYDPCAYHYGVDHYRDAELCAQLENGAPIAPAVAGGPPQPTSEQPAPSGQVQASTAAEQHVHDVLMCQQNCDHTSWSCMSGCSNDPRYGTACKYGCSNTRIACRSSCQ